MSIPKAKPNLLIYKKHFKYYRMINQKHIMIITVSIEEITHQKPATKNKIISIKRLIAPIENNLKNNHINNGKT